MRKNWNIRAPWNPLGYGIVGQNVVKGLMQSNDYDITYWPIGQVQPASQEDIPYIQNGIKNQDNYDNYAPSLNIWHEFALAEHIGKGKHIGWPIFELNNFNDRAKHHLSRQDTIFVCSKWAKEVVVERAFVRPENVYVVPLGVDLSIFQPRPKQVKSDTFKFFNIGKWEIRKGHDVLWDIFTRAFRPDDNVELYMLCNNPFLTEKEHEEWASLYKDNELGNKIHILPRLQSQLEVANFISNCDCGIFPARAEGWNLELLESMACGKPVITTNYSAHTEFCTQENSFLVTPKNLEQAFDGKWFFGQGEWAELGESEINTFVELARQVFQDNVSTNQKGLETAGRYTWTNTVLELDHIYNKVVSNII